MADLEHAVPITTETVFEIGSTSKHFTAAAVLLAAVSLACTRGVVLKPNLPVKRHRTPVVGANQEGEAHTFGSTRTGERCIISDGAEDESRATVIIDDRELTMAEFGRLLTTLRRLGHADRLRARRRDRRGADDRGQGARQEVAARRGTAR
jgi:hypothetical protein